MRIPNDVRRPLRFFSWQLPQPGSWSIPSRTSCAEPFVFADVQARNKAKFNLHLTSTFSHKWFTRTVEVTICIISERLLDRPRQLPHVKLHNSPSRPKIAQGTTRQTVEGRWVAAQKPPQQHLAGETSLLGTTRSPTAVVRAPVIQGGQPSFEFNRVSQISRALSCRRERFCQ